MTEIGRRHQIRFLHQRRVFFTARHAKHRTEGIRFVHTHRPLQGLPRRDAAFLHKGCPFDRTRRRVSHHRTRQLPGISSRSRSKFPRHITPGIRPVVKGRRVNVVRIRSNRLRVRLVRQSYHHLRPTLQTADGIGLVRRPMLNPTASDPAT